MAVEWVSPELLALAFGSGGVGSLLTQWRISRKSVRTDEFKAITEAQNRRIQELKDDVATLKREAEHTKAGWMAEMDAHEKTRAKLRTALRYIRVVTNWLAATDHPSAPPELPADLLDDVQ